MSQTKIFKTGAFLIVCSLLSQVLFIPNTKAASQAKTLSDETTELNRDLSGKRSRVKEIQGLINSYQDKIKSQESQQLSLSNQILLLDNRIREKELRLDEAKAQIEVIDLELQALDADIGRQETKINVQKEILSDLVRKLRQSDDVNTLQIFLSRPSLSSYFDRIEELKSLQGDLGQTLERIKNQKTQLESDKQDRENKLKDLEAQKKQLRQDALKLEMEKNSKQSLLAETKDKQEEFNRLVSELRQQSEATADEIANIERDLKDKLEAIDVALANGQTLLLWPVPVRKITTTFHDPTYPFRNLFEHPGVDLRANVGTPIKAAAGGYVAWTKLGSMYGNYIMLIHPGNLATVYGHMTKFNVKAGTYVERGDVIGFTGGMPGQPGAGLSTGPHLHFEVRQDGIPVDPMGFLPEAIETDELIQ
ncbi:MAG: peptidoglycan DD-metalloendopeptidase family protein [Patescibacteria group bacterium]|nr:peptidoglycan DD-metalloendopeptidase family protein [Patescibacteria group bacterium]